MLDNILCLKEKFDVFILDIYGVIWGGKEPIKGALEVMQELKKVQKKVILLSNSTLRQKQAEEFQAQKGFIKGIHYDEIYTSGELVYDTFSHDKRKLKYYTFARPNPEVFQNSPYQEVFKPEQADFVYLGSPQVFENAVWKDQLNIEYFEKQLKQFYHLGLPLICANPDLRAYEDQYDESVIRQGTIARYYEDLGGDVEYFGKPYPLIFDFALQNTQALDNKILMVGDTLETDVLGAKTYGIKTALVMTGIARDHMKEEEFSSMEEYCKEVQIIPDYIVKTI